MSDVSPACYEEVRRKLATFRSRHVKMVWRRRQQVREEVTGKLVPVEFELNRHDKRHAPQTLGSTVRKRTTRAAREDVRIEERGGTGPIHRRNASRRYRWYSSPQGF